MYHNIALKRRKGGERWIANANISCTISLLFTSHCVHNRGPEAKETTMRHVAAFFSVCIVCTTRDIAVLSDPTREKCFVAGQTTLSLCRRDKRIFPRGIVPLYCAAYSRIFMRIVNGIPRFTLRTIVAVSIAFEIP